MHISKWFSVLLDVRLLGQPGKKKKKKEHENHSISTFNVPSSIRFGGLES
jgi:hypothetical protein